MREGVEPAKAQTLGIESGTACTNPALYQGTSLLVPKKAGKQGVSTPDGNYFTLPGHLRNQLWRHGLRT
jgi:hypothetical protein